MIMRVSGRVSRISRQASTPLPSGSRTSITTTSGFSLAATATASATLPASATTDMPGRRSSSARKPSRTTSWSSTSITRISSAIHPPKRYAHGDRRAEAALTGDLQDAAELYGPVPHIRNAATGVESRHIGSNPIIAHDQDQSIIRNADFQTDPAGQRVLSHVGQTLFGDLQQLSGLRLGELRRDFCQGWRRPQVRVNEAIHAQVLDQYPQAGRQ